MRRLAFTALMQRLIKKGQLHIIDHSGRKQTFGTDTQHPVVTMRLHSRSIVGKLLIDPDLAIGEGYMAGEISIENGTIYDFIYLMANNLDQQSLALARLWHAFGLWKQRAVTMLGRISLKAARANVAHHYDLPPKLYDLFLDTDKQYSCAYFRTLDNDLDTAQLDKKRHLAAKLRLKPGLTVLDIGCGWGGLALYLAQNFQVNVVGLTLSAEQLKIAIQRAAQAGLADRVKFLLCDYREMHEQFDRIVSVGMFEHVGRAQFKTFFQQIRNLLVDDGLALLHSIGVEYNPGLSSQWIGKYIFPGGYLPALSEVLPVIEQQRLHITDIELLHHHYAATLQAWRQRFMANVAQLPAHLDARFVRMWEYYLAGSQVSFQKLGLMNFQIQLMKNKQCIPLTRDYIYEAEHMSTRS